ncbi:MAG: GNAT family N-acetyltransferase [Acidobacteriaceae bacterium]|nr:GNAT family N-acetyltransferase [Acidobacteriaceae bacterium]
MPHFTIRSAALADADQIAAAHVDSIHSLGAKAYGPDIITAWGAPRDGERYRRAMESGELFFVATESDSTDERVLGFSSYRVEDGKHRTAIYVRGEAARTGVGSALFKAAETAAREHGAKEIHVDASLAAVGFYKRQGFEELVAGQHQLKGGTLMDCVFMRKSFRP